MNETRRRLAPGIFDNHVLRLWHDWQPLVAQVPALADEWRYERDDSGILLAGPSEALERTEGNVHLRVILGGDGLYTPLAEMIDKHGVALVGPERVRTSVSPERSRNLFEAIAGAEEAAGRVGETLPACRRGKRHLPRAAGTEAEGKGGRE